ncbi:Lon protease family protein [Alicyclobacillus sp. ALC3]|uniref:Lon protease family protein n=1 Tax=Alicyclobacillus sp. ALC3 TaxID=2796143 RepID=UPI00237975E3|nr:ATP-binding protein [Alicyclobacillus sp. ALC3]WDL96142.1 AAA family ATPase [Alicyclobacillus sp. ALC3]
MPDGNLRSARELTVEDLEARTRPSELGFEDTSELTPESFIIGQSRAVAAMDFGLHMNAPGYNLFVAGPTGTGKTTYVLDKVREVAVHRKAASDWCYVHNFSAPDEPYALSFPPCHGREFARSVANLMDAVEGALTSAFNSDSYHHECSELEKSIALRVEELWSKLEAYAREFGFSLRKTATGVVTVMQKPDGTPLTRPEFEAMPQQEQDEIRQHQTVIADALEATLHHVTSLQAEALSAQRTLDERTARFAVEHLFTPLLTESGNARIQGWLSALRDDVILHHRELRSVDVPAQGTTIQASVDLTRRYKVNVLVDQTGESSAPVVIESNPTYFNLFGRVEYKSVQGGMVADFTMIKPGALHRANGGYLVLQVRDLLTRPVVWDGLKRALRNRFIKVENPLEDQLWPSTSSLRPEVIPLQVKVILLGTADIFQWLYEYDEELQKHFKVKVEFDSSMDRTPEANRQYAHFIAAYANANGLPPFSAAAVARILDESSKQSGSHDKLSTRFNPIIELLNESGYFTRIRGSDAVDARDVDEALDKRRRRSSLIREKVLQQILDGTILVAVSGERVGQVNGLAVLSTGDYAFGEPHRITARTYSGRRGVVNVERETALSGHIHDKGLLILGAYLSGEFAAETPLSVTATLVFEQTYSMIDGDSASSTELYAILSSLSGVPIQQGIAATGSVNQFGEIQPIGGVNEKIEGFYYICRAKGLTGTQGVIIPHQNVRHLFLSRPVQEAVQSGMFHIWPVTHVSEGIEILTGLPAGERPFDENTVFGKVERRLQTLSHVATHAEHPS